MLEKFTVFIFVFVFILAAIDIPYNVYKAKIKKEWNNKVNNCILDINFRKDCNLIIYKDMQIHDQQTQQKQLNSVFAGAMVGSIVGSSIKE